MPENNQFEFEVRIPFRDRDFMQVVLESNGPIPRDLSNIVIALCKCVINKMEVANKTSDKNRDL